MLLMCFNLKWFAKDDKLTCICQELTQNNSKNKRLRQSSCKEHEPRIWKNSRNWITTAKTQIWPFRPLNSLFFVLTNHITDTSIVEPKELTKNIKSSQICIKFQLHNCSPNDSQQKHQILIQNWLFEHLEPKPCSGTKNIH